jgi:spore coat protein H
MFYLLLACFAPTALEVGSSGKEGGPSSPEEEADVIPPAEELPEEEGGDDWIFTQGQTHNIRLEIGTDGQRKLNRDPYTAVPALAWYDDRPMGTIGVRLRGKIGSFRDLNGKPKLQLDTNAFAEGERFYGLEGLSLNNTVVDCSSIKDPLATRTFAAAGVAASRTTYARVSIDDEAYGLYVVVETPDDRFLKRNFEQPDGTLYDGKYLYYDNGSYTLLDFTPDLVDSFQQEEGEDVGHADLRALTDAVTASWGTDHFMSDLDPYLNWEEYLTELAVEQLTGHLDGYALNTNNYRVYFDPADGKAKLIPWDFDYAYLEESWWGMSWTNPRGLLASGCLQDAACKEALRQKVSEVLEKVPASEVSAWATELLDWVEGEDDPRAECGRRDILSERQRMQAWPEAREAALRQQWDL